MENVVLMIIYSSYCSKYQNNIKIFRHVQLFNSASKVKLVGSFESFKSEGILRNERSA
jgi:hypothetical protein